MDLYNKRCEAKRKDSKGNDTWHKVKFHHWGVEDGEGVTYSVGIVEDFYTGEIITFRPWNIRFPKGNPNLPRPKTRPPIPERYGGNSEPPKRNNKSLMDGLRKVFNKNNGCWISVDDKMPQPNVYFQSQRILVYDGESVWYDVHVVYDVNEPFTKFRFVQNLFNEEKETQEIDNVTHWIAYPQPNFN